MNILPPVSGGSSGGGGNEYFPHIDFPGGTRFYPCRGYNFTLPNPVNNLTANTLYLTPYVNTVPGAVGMAVSINGTGAQARFGIYNADPVTGLPTTLDIDLGAFNTSPNGTLSMAFPTPRDWSGLKWMATVCNLQWGVVSAIPINGIPDAAVGVTSLGAAGIAFACFTGAFAYGALPASVPAISPTSTTPGYWLYK